MLWKSRATNELILFRYVLLSTGYCDTLSPALHVLVKYQIYITLFHLVLYEWFEFIYIFIHSLFIGQCIVYMTADPSVTDHNSWLDVSPIDKSTCSCFFNTDLAFPILSSREMAGMNDIITESTRLVSACYGQPTLNKKSITRHSYGQLKCASLAQRCRYWFRWHLQKEHLKTQNMHICRLVLGNI